MHVPNFMRFHRIHRWDFSVLILLDPTQGVTLMPVSLSVAKRSEHKACQTNQRLQHPIWGPCRAAQQPAALLFSIIWLSPACHLALVHEARPGICGDTYLVGGWPPPFVWQPRWVKRAYAAEGRAVFNLTERRQMGCWRSPISGLQSDDSADAHDPDAWTSCLGWAFGTGKNFCYSHHKRLINNLVSLQIYGKPRTRRVRCHSVRLKKIIRHFPFSTFNLNVYRVHFHSVLFKCMFGVKKKKSPPKSVLCVQNIWHVSLGVLLVEDTHYKTSPVQLQPAAFVACHPGAASGEADKNATCVRSE